MKRFRWYFVQVILVMGYVVIDIIKAIKMFILPVQCLLYLIRNLDFKSQKL